jgi:hypothetical protein
VCRCDADGRGLSLSATTSVRQSCCARQTFGDLATKPRTAGLESRQPPDERTDGLVTDNGNSDASVMLSTQTLMPGLGMHFYCVFLFHFYYHFILQV